MRKYMGACIVVFALFMAVLLPSGFAAAQATYPERGSGYTAAPGHSAPAGAVYQYNKTKEEIAWDLMMYGLQTIPTFKARIKDYNDLLAAYRQALRTVREQDR